MGQLIRRLVKDAKKEREACHDLRAAGDPHATSGITAKAIAWKSRNYGMAQPQPFRFDCR